MDKNFINFHILISHSPSCLNRDDMNMQKSAVFGGKRRVRISSQSLKRTMRTSDYYRNHLGEASIRCKHLDLLKEEFLQLLNGEFEENIIQETLERFVRTKTNDDTDEDSESEGNDSSEKKLAVAPWVKEEFRILCQAVKEVKQKGLAEDERQKAMEKFEKQKGKKKKDVEYFMDQIFTKKIEDRIAVHAEALSKAVGSAVDVALSGRMATSGLMTTIDGAMAVAHSITTHLVDADIDWFTAVDDLQAKGSGHLDTQEFSSGVFYRYASLNLKQLQVNLSLIPDIKALETLESRKAALDVAAHVLHMLTTEVPSAKQQSFAAHNLADMAMVSFSDLPVSLANAFESPVKHEDDGGFLKPSIKALHNYWQAVHTGYGLDERCGEFVIADTPPTGMKAAKTLEELKTWVLGNGEA